MPDDITSLSKSLKEMNETLIRIDERTKHMAVGMEEQKEEIIKLRNDTDDKIKQINKRHDDHVRAMEEKFVTKEKYGPVEKLVYGLVGLVLTSVVGALVAMVVASPK